MGSSLSMVSLLMAGPLGTLGTLSVSCSRSPMHGLLGVLWRLRERAQATGSGSRDLLHPAPPSVAPLLALGLTKPKGGSSCWHFATFSSITKLLLKSLYFLIKYLLCSFNAIHTCCTIQFCKIPPVFSPGCISIKKTCRFPSLQATYSSSHKPSAAWECLVCHIYF